MRNSKWNGLDFYKEGQVIYGRDTEIKNITKAIDQNIQTIIYGQSGIGKSSLLNAGIFPKLRDLNYFPFVIRFEGLSESIDFEEYVISQIKNAAQADCALINKESLILQCSHDEFNETKDIWQFLNSTKFITQNGESYIPVIIFDQLEELLNNYKIYNKSVNLLKILYTLIEGTAILPDSYIGYTNYRFVFSIREDYLYKLEDIIDKYNLAELKLNRFRIKALTRQSASDVMKNTFSYDIIQNTSEQVFQQILNFTSNEIGEVNTLALSLSCTLLAENSQNKITIEDVKTTDQLIYSFYLNKVSFLPLQTRRFLERELITSDGRRDSLDFIGAIESGYITEEDFNILSRDRIVRITSHEAGMKRVEFIHDSIARVISKHKISKWDIIKQLYKGRNNLSGRVGLQDFDSLTVPSYIYFILFCVIFEITICMKADCNVGLKISLVLLDTSFLLVSYKFIKTYISTWIKRCHDVNMSGWCVLNPKKHWNLNKISSLVYHKPQLSYYYSNCSFNHFRYSTSIGRYEYYAILLKLIITYIKIELIVICPLYIFRQNIGMDEFSKAVMLQALSLFGFFYALAGTCAFKRLIRMRIWPILGSIPIIGLIIPCFKSKHDNEEISNESNHSISFLLFLVLEIILCEVFVFFPIVFL